MRPEKRTVRLMNILYEKDLPDRHVEKIEHAIDCGLSDDELFMLADEDLTYEQLLQGFYGFMCGLTEEEVASYLKPEINIDVMKQLRISYLKPDERKVLPFILADDFNVEQILEIRKGCKLPLKYIQLYASSYFSAKQMEQLRIGFEHGVKYQTMCFISDSRFSIEQMRYLREIAELGADKSFMELLAQPDIPEDSMYSYLKKIKQVKRNEERQKHAVCNLTI